MYLVDTSVWINFFRGNDTPLVKVLKELLTGDQIVGIAPIILQEILQGANSEERFDKWQKYFSELHCYSAAVPLESHIAAARLYQTCTSAGKTPRSSNDCLIARIAIEHDLILLADDRDFAIISSLVPELRLYPA